ncbi:MAG: AAA family ATPase, partial [Acidimicrobiales bacterium]
EADGGPSGRLGGWAISGIPRQAWEIHATRSAQIDAAVGVEATYRERAVAARATRDRKTHDQSENLVARWRSELTQAGFPPLELAHAVRLAGVEYQRPAMEVTDGLAAQLLAPEGALAQTKTFTQGDVIVAVAPLLHGLPVSVLDGAVEAVLRHELAVALPQVTGCREPVFAAAVVIAEERHIAELAEVLVSRPAERVDAQMARAAILDLECARGVRLTDTQRHVAQRLLSAGHSVDVVVGVAGSGKTTTLAAVRAGYEAAGFQVIGAATSGAAAKTLGEGAGIDSATVASLTWRLDNHRLALSDRHVVIVDEAGMTTDADIGALLGAVEAAGARIIIVGDYRQLDAVGPGGALEALSRRHPEHLWTLGENLRQVDPGERHALDHLRAGHLPTAVSWYGDNDRIHPAASRPEAVSEMIAAWANDVEAGRDALLVAYRRDSVEALNVAARKAWGALGRLSGPQLRTPDGRSFQAGDRIITLAPGPQRAWVTSQKATVTAVDPGSGSLTAVTPEGTRLHFGTEDLSADKIAYGYAITAHRSQGVTVDVTHTLADGGGRELAYVAMSRARGESHVHLVTAEPAEAGERLAWEWEGERRQTWNLDRPDPRQSVAELISERYELVRSIPPDQSSQLTDIRRRQADIDREVAQLRAGTGQWAYTPAGQAHTALEVARDNHERVTRRVNDPALGWRGRRSARNQLPESVERLQRAEQAWHHTTAPIIERYGIRRHELAQEAGRLERGQVARRAFLDQHPDTPERIHQLDGDIEIERERQRRLRLERHPYIGRDHQPSRSPEIGRRLDRRHGPDMGISL